MERHTLRKKSARLGYNLGYGAKRHFATHDIVGKVPAYFGVVTFAFGIIFLKYPNTLMSDIVSMLTSALGFAIFYLNFYTNDLSLYEEIGKKINIFYHNSLSIFEKAESCPENELDGLAKELDLINDEFQKISIYKQVFLSNELAHFKLFGESQSEWFVKELKLGFWKDKIPALWRIYALILLLIIVTFLACNFHYVAAAIDCIREK